MSILPKCLVEPEISASTSARREMLQAITWASPPALRIPPATSSQASALRLEITTLAPSFAKSSAEERPMPRLEPVITATLPVRSNGVDCMGTYSLLVRLLLSFRHGGARRRSFASRRCPGHPRPYFQERGCPG